MSNFDFWSSPDEPAVISLGNTPGAMQFTRIFASAKVLAIILVKWIKPVRFFSDCGGYRHKLISLTRFRRSICELTTGTTLHDTRNGCNVDHARGVAWTRIATFGK